jgi:hypothetical protein
MNTSTETSSAQTVATARKRGREPRAGDRNQGKDHHQEGPAQGAENRQESQLQEAG